MIAYSCLTILDVQVAWWWFGTTANISRFSSGQRPNNKHVLFDLTVFLLLLVYTVLAKCRNHCNEPNSRNQRYLRDHHNGCCWIRRSLQSRYKQSLLKRIQKKHDTCLLWRSDVFTLCHPFGLGGSSPRGGL